MAEKIFYYKNRPLVRNGDTIYYGYMDKPFVTVLTVKSTRELEGQQVADKVVVQLVNTDPTVTRLKDKITKMVERKGLYSALEIGSIWLERELKDA